MNRTYQSEAGKFVDLLSTEMIQPLSAVEQLSVLVRSNLKRATRLRQSILQKAFSGELV
jgi:hypothetical protein